VGLGQRDAEEVIPASRQRNYLQSALYLAIAGVLAAVLLERLLTYAEVAEKAAMEATLSQLSAALYARVAYLALRGEYEAIDALRDGNPFISGYVKFPNYLGEFDAVPAGDIAEGKWLYDRARRELVYVPNLRRYLQANAAGHSDGALRFRLEVRKVSKQAYTGILLEPVGDTRWAPVP
jgi:hypothetical protein